MPTPPPPEPGSLPGVGFTTRHDRPVRGRHWCFWYLEHSKKVWFRLKPPQAAEALHLEFRYRGRPILHRSELPPAGPLRRRQPVRPVVWGDRLGFGFAEGPDGTSLYLSLWTRWTWIHPEACGHPQLFSVRLVTPPANAGAAHSPRA